MNNNKHKKMSKRQILTRLLALLLCALMLGSTLFAILPVFTSGNDSTTHTESHEGHNHD